jgi:phosphoglycolate phosphatase
LKLVIFDCDGTLVDSQHIIAAAMERAFDSVGVAWPGRQRTLAIVGLSLSEAISSLIPTAPPPILAALQERYREAFFALRQDPERREPIFEGALEALGALARRGDVALGIATGKSRRGVQALLERFELTGHFATIQTADDAPSKPHPAMVRQAMAEVGAEPAASIVVGDTVFDVEMARAAGAAAVGVAWGYHPEPALRQAGADRIAGRFGDLEAILDAIWKERS